MPHREIFPNAPITEALVDIRATLPTDASLEQLLAFQDPIKERYPEKRVRIQWQVGHQLKPGASPSMLDPKGGPDGYIFVSNDAKQMVQARLDGFTFNKLKPYDRWETLRDEAMELWSRFTELARPTSINRLALRYVNRIEIPLPSGDLKDYLVTGPEIARGLPQGLATFFMRLMIPSEDGYATAIVTITMDPPRSEHGPLPIIFDIDAFREESLDPKTSDISKTFEYLHDFKNNIFFGSITEKCKELFRGEFPSR